MAKRLTAKAAQDYLGSSRDNAEVLFNGFPPLEGAARERQVSENSYRRGAFQVAWMLKELARGLDEHGMAEWLMEVAVEVLDKMRRSKRAFPHFMDAAKAKIQKVIR